MEKILLFQIKETEQIRRLAARMKIKVCCIDTNCYKETLKSLYQGVTVPSEEYQGDAPSESLMVFCNIPEKKFDKMLAALKKEHIYPDYKAVMTPTNANWNILRLYFEMEKEKKAYGLSGN
ncbi:MAG: DUF3783 domain-containing protein [Butyribacter sp.]|nr:DUF3783 domain-containing protein [bacterium]MDY3854548.1 DUF3783 domain-containing protein [Butyribacter sp.]